VQTKAKKHRAYSANKIIGITSTNVSTTGATEKSLGQPTPRLQEDKVAKPARKINSGNSFLKNFVFIIAVRFVNRVGYKGNKIIYSFVQIIYLTFSKFCILSENGLLPTFLAIFGPDWLIKPKNAQYSIKFFTKCAFILLPLEAVPCTISH
jgi:hypothetical protein